MSPDISQIPDRIEAIVAWRGWRYYAYQGTIPRTRDSLVQSLRQELVAGKLLSVNGGFPWEPGESSEADCTTGILQRLLHPHEAPREDCSCGIYCAKDLPTLQALSYQDGNIYGELWIWGKIVEAEFGYRAQFAYPKSLYVNPRLAPFAIDDVVNFIRPLCVYKVPIYLALKGGPVMIYEPEGDVLATSVLVDYRKNWYEAQRRMLAARKLQIGDRVAVTNMNIILIVKDIFPPIARDPITTVALFGNDYATEVDIAEITWFDPLNRWECRLKGNYVRSGR